eukprot:TRINITY_DN9559_c0_g1_i1.p1 TRINITY_DN9559_c0_g1~~TRINITY_DN9559_c0_g1_i1.p1  ORF type:complete len:100 (-),score=17.39 TRINITY_DN9559_c0_g1_i1:217-516(-)
MCLQLLDGGLVAELTATEVPVIHGHIDALSAVVRGDGDSNLLIVDGGIAFDVEEEVLGLGKVEDNLEGDLTIKVIEEKVVAVVNRVDHNVEVGAEVLTL